MTGLTTRSIETIAGEIKALRQQSLGCAIEIGRRLTEAKEMLPYGEWGKWLKTEVEFSQSTADNLMQLFDGYGSPQSALFGAELNSQALGKLSVTNALRLLAVPEDEREEFAEEHDVEHMSTRELDRLIKEKKEAEEAKDTAERLLAEAEESNARSLAEAQERADTKDAELKEKADKVRELTEQLEQIKNEPINVPVAPQANPEVMAKAIKKATDEAEKARKKEIADLEKKLKDAQKDKETALTEKTTADTEKQKALDALMEEQKKTEAAEKQLETLKKAQAMSDPIVTEFGVIFNEVQTKVKQLKDLAKTAGENRVRLEAALVRFIDACKVEEGK